MDTSEMKARIAELEQIIESKRTSMSKTRFNSWHSRANEVFELCTLKAKAQSVEPRQRQTRSNGNWRNDPATSRQIQYLNRLGVQLEDEMSKGRASELIEAAKGGCLGSVGGWFRDGSN